MNKEEKAKRVIEMYTLENKSINLIAKELKMGWATVKKILVKENVAIIPKVNQYGCNNGVRNNLFKEINDSESAYWLGFLYADGNIRYDRNEISLELQEKDRKVIEDFHYYCQNKNSIHKHIIKRDGKEYISYCSSFSNAAVKTNLYDKGCIPRKSLALNFPTKEQVPDEYLYDFIRGYVDGDGHIRYDKRYEIVILGTKNFLQGLLSRIDKNWHYSLSQDKNSSIWKLDIWRKEDVFEFLVLLYKDSSCHLDRKYNVYKNAIWAREE